MTAGLTHFLSHKGDNCRYQIANNCKVALVVVNYYNLRTIFFCQTVFPSQEIKIDSLSLLIVALRHTQTTNLFSEHKYLIL